MATPDNWDWLEGVLANPFFMLALQRLPEEVWVSIDDAIVAELDRRAQVEREQRVVAVA